MMRLPNSVESVDCYTSWCSRYFELMGDKEPNTDGEIHLEYHIGGVRRIQS